MATQKVLALTVGTGRQGEPADPIEYSLERENPDYVVFYVSKESKELTLTKVLDRTKRKEGSYEVCTCADEDDIMGCYHLFRESLLHLIRDGVTEPKRIAVDYTTGTKAMSAALVMAGISLGVDSLNYISGKRENGIVVSGAMRLHAMSPFAIYWEALHGQVIENFNAYRFTECLRLLEEMRPMIAERDKQERVEFLRVMAESYLAWDLFDTEKALNGLRNLNNRHLLEEYGCKLAVEKNIGFLHREIEDGDYSLEKAGDLFENARRRFAEGKYDDSVARLYRLLEYISQVTLYKRYSITTTKVLLSNIPENCRDLFSEKGDKIDIGLRDGYKLLERLNHPIGIMFCQKWDELNTILSARNNSILAHGFSPLGKHKAEQIFALVEPFLKEITKEKRNSLIGKEFPQLKKLSTYP